MNYILFLDDIRWPDDVTWPLLCADGSRSSMREIFGSDNCLATRGPLRVQNYFEFCEFIKHEGIPGIVFFDHDLAPEHYSGSHQYGTNEKTGADCARWLVEHCLEQNHRLPLYYVHSMNPDGAQNIRSILETAKRILPELA